MKLSIISLKIMSLVFGLIGLVMALSFFFLDWREGVVAILLALLMATMGSFVWSVAKHLKKGVQWAKTSSVVIFTVSLISPFFPLGILGHIGLMIEEKSSQQSID